MNRLFFLLLLSVSTLTLAQQQDAPGRWSAAKATAWYDKEPFLVGANYAPANAINELEMFQADTFDPATIDKELAMAESIGMNTMRVFLHDLLWQDPAGFTKRLDQFLTLMRQTQNPAYAGAIRLVLGPDAKTGYATRTRTGLP